MSSYAQFSSEAPDLAAAVRSRFEAHLHHVVATLRRDGSPRVSGTEARFFDGELYLGSMPGSRKGADLHRDPRVALHAATVDVELTDGDAKVAGRAIACDLDEASRFFASLGHPADPPDGEAFRLDLDEAVLTKVDGDELVVARWSPGEPPTEIRRK